MVHPGCLYHFFNFPLELRMQFFSRVFPSARYRGARLIQGSQFHKSPKSHQQFWLLHWAGCDVQLLGSLDPRRLSQSIFSSKACSLYSWPLLQKTQRHKQHLLVLSSPNYPTIGSISDIFPSLIPALTKQHICACVFYELCQCFVFFQVMGQNVRKIFYLTQSPQPPRHPLGLFKPQRTSSSPPVLHDYPLFQELLKKGTFII